MLSYRHNIPPTNGPRTVVIDDDPPPPVTRGRLAPAYDWDKIEERARRGLVPPAPKLTPSGERIARKIKREIITAVRAGDLAKLKEINVPNYNSTVRILKRYRDICIVALRASKVAS